MSKQLMEEGIQIANKHIKRGSTSQIISKMQRQKLDLFHMYQINKNKMSENIKYGWLSGKLEALKHC